MQEPTHQLEAYFAGEYTAEQLRAIEAWIQADPDNAEAFMEQLHFRELVGQHLRDQRDEAGSVLTELARLEAQASAMTVTLHNASDWHHPTPSPSRQQWHAALSYVLHHTLTSKRIAIMATAAAMVLGAILTIVLLGNTESSPGVAQRPEVAEVPDASIDKPVTIVATLTAEHNAVWDHQPGQDLYAGQRLTLTAGFAEITTNHGAIAVLEAPATIELIDSPNALRLHAGKLVGICETESSKGFLVRTPHMDITDLGTRFGAVIDRTGRTSVHVIEGEVAVSTKNGRIKAHELHSSESLSLNETGREVSDSVVQSFEHLFGVHGGLIDYSDLIRFQATHSNRVEPSTLSSDTEVFLIQELPVALLPADVGVSLTEPGRHGQFLPTNLTSQTLLAGTAVRSYVIRVNSITKKNAYLGSMTFDAPILGIQLLPDDWKAFVELMPERAITIHPMPDELIEGRDFLPAHDQPNDWLDLSDDRKTLDFHFTTLAGRTDHVRVFVAPPAPAAPR